MCCSCQNLTYVKRNVPDAHEYFILSFLRFLQEERKFCLKSVKGLTDYTDIINIIIYLRLNFLCIFWCRSPSPIVLMFDWNEWYCMLYCGTLLDQTRCILGVRDSHSIVTERTISIKHSPFEIFVHEFVEITHRKNNMH